MRKSKRLNIILGCVFVAVILLALFGRAAVRPAMPVEWHKLQKGMSRKEAVVILQGEVEDLRELKGFDQVTSETTVHGCPSIWQLHVVYDNTGYIKSASVRFVCRSHGLFNTSASLFK